MATTHPTNADPMTRGTARTRGRAHLLLALVGVAFLVAACRDDASPADATPAASPTPTAVCLQGDDFRESGVVARFDGDAGAARRLQDLRWAAHPGCERFVIDLADEGGTPVAGTAGVRVELLREVGVIRVHLPAAVRSTAKTEVATGGRLITHAYAVRSLDAAPSGGIFVDVHLGAPALARALLLPGPARVVVDVRPGGAALPSRPLRDRRVVLLRPTGGEASYPLTIAGYSRHFEATTVALIRQGGEVRAQDFTTAVDYLETWGEYRIVIARGPTGEVELFVGEISTRDGSEEGMRFRLRMR